MGALLFVVWLVGAPDQIGTKHLIATYAHAPDHAAFEICKAHAKTLSAASETLAYFCKEIPEWPPRKETKPDDDARP